MHANSGSKKESGLFDVSMGAYDGAETWELVASFLLHELSEKTGQTTLAYAGMMSKYS